jgi:anti-sigma factor RsiW
VTPDELTCRELVELVTEYFEGALPSGERLRFEEHLETCSPCRAYLEQMRRTIDVVGHIPPDALSPAAERDLAAAFRDWKRG